MGGENGMVKWWIILARVWRPRRRGGREVLVVVVAARRRRS
jgi:hypothetical protein